MNKNMKFLQTSVPPKVLKTNASFLLKNDFDYISGYGSSNCWGKGICTSDLVPIKKTLKKGTKVTGSLIRNYKMSPQLGSNGLDFFKLSDLKFTERYVPFELSVNERIYSPSKATGSTVLPKFSDVLELKNMGFNGNPLIIPIELLEDIPIELLEEDKVKKSDSLIAKKTDNTNVLIVVGALLVGYALFSSNDSN